MTRSKTLGAFKSRPSSPLLEKRTDRGDTSTLMTKSQKKSGRRGSRVQEQFAFISVNASLVEKDRGESNLDRVSARSAGNFPIHSSRRDGGKGSDSAGLLYRTGGGVESSSFDVLSLYESPIWRYGIRGGLGARATVAGANVPLGTVPPISRNA